MELSQQVVSLELARKLKSLVARRRLSRLLEQLQEPPRWRLRDSSREVSRRRGTRVRFPAV
jgi:hypothetical protein